jgi:hypothetical protein
MSTEREANKVFASERQGIPEQFVTSFDKTLADEFGIRIAQELVPLPSRGLIYPANHPFHGCTEVMITSMTTKEQDILTSRALFKKGTAITELLRSCLVDKRVDPADLISGDRNAILVAIRITGYGAEYKGSLTCNVCNEQFEQSFDLAQLPIRTLDNHTGQLGENLFDYVLPVTNARVVYKYLTGRDEEENIREAEKNKKLGISTADSAISSGMLSSIISVNGVTDRTKLGMFVKRMPAADSSAFRKHLRDSEPTILMKQEATCAHCGNVEEVNIPLGTSFLWPDISR